MRIAIDGMGGDNAPSAIVEGISQAVREFDFDIVIVGDTEKIDAELSRHKVPRGRVSIQHSSEVVGMQESPVIAVRKKRDSSISVAVNLVKTGKADALVSAGNTGAVVVASTLSLRMLKGIERPGIAIAIPTQKGVSLIIDVGANIAPKPIHMLQYALMGDVYARHILKKTNPSVGLLNVGEEETKGTDFMIQIHGLLSESHLNFCGNVEGRDIFEGDCDVIVCDGFVGNVVLKVSEGIAVTINQMLRRQLNRTILTKLGALLSISAFRELKRETDYAEYGGAPLLGVDGTCIICHGSSSAKAIKNAIRVAGEFISHKVNKEIEEKAAEIVMPGENINGT
ncbi:MAG: phosphate--acyl-ACP acyltransferase [Candidatus Omnitrophica bacterium CG1_02_49_10]|nr:MAG: phosphate--acyl-ACP acyltransferase [Candidatus Omnitrophica bacterium CG1_02_49_10]